MRSNSSANIAARLDRLPPSRYVTGLVLRLSLGGWFELYDLFMTGYIALGLTNGGLFAATTRGLFDVHGFASFIASGFAGMFVGTLVFGWISDRFGRRATFTLSLVWYSLATFVMAFMTSDVAIDVWRFIAGIGIGVQLVTIDAYISELTPKETRGGSIALSQFVGYLAVPVVAFLAYAFSPPHMLHGLAGWRIVALVGSLGAVVVWILRRGLPESPRWLAACGDAAAADALTSEIERHVASERGAPLVEPAASASHGDEARVLVDIWRPPFRTRTIVLVIFNFLQTVGFYGFASWVPLLLANEGVSIVHSLQYTFLIAIVNPLGPLIAMYTADRWQRKWQIVWLSVAIALCGLVFAQMRAPVWIVFFGTLITLANAWFSCAFHAYQAEVYPTRIRAQAVGFVYSWSRFSSIFVGFFIAAILARYGSIGVFILIAAAMAVVAAVIALFGLRTNRVALEALSR